MSDLLCVCPLCGAPREPQKDHSWTKGLSVRAANALIHDGIHSKKEVIELITSRYGLRRIRNIGYALEKEIQDWINT